MKKSKILISLVLACMMLLSACGGSAPAATTEAAAPAAASYTGTAQGMGGEVSVTLTIENGVITDCVATGDKETDGIGPVELGQDHSGTGAEAGKEAAEHIDQRSRGAYRRQGPGADKTAHDDGIHCVVHLLKKSTQQDRKEENQDLFPDDPFCDLPGGCDLTHAGTSAFF